MSLIHITALAMTAIPTTTITASATEIRNDCDTYNYNRIRQGNLKLNFRCTYNRNTRNNIHDHNLKP